MSAATRPRPSTRRAAAALCAALATATAAAAADTLDIDLQWTSDYVLRGLSQTAGQPAAQAGVRWRSAGGTFAGVWASPAVVDPAYGRIPEVDLYLGHDWRFDAASLRVSAVRYAYASHPRGEPNYDYSELIASLDLYDRVTATLGWSPDSIWYSPFGPTRRGTMRTVEVAFRQPLPARFTLLASAGFHDQPAAWGSGYCSFAGGVAWDAGPWSIAVQRFATDAPAREWYGDTVAGRRWALTVSWHWSK
jgi:uncharacterized protein (TIGR02001 family)